jgi:HPt (histidine-containing phosphotransfer) domain-containing protein
LEQKAGHCKAIVERAKAKSNVMQLKYENLKSQLSSAGSLSSSDIHRIVQTQSEAEDAALQLDETETGFQTIVQEYETRMPEIIKTIRRLNTERIEQFKYSMEQWTSQKREVLTGMIKSLDSLTDAVKSINAQKDLVSFSEGSTDFWNIGRLRGDSKGVKTRRSAHNDNHTSSPHSDCSTLYVL